MAAGKKTGGRQKGSLNKTTHERLERARIVEQVAAEIGAPASVTSVVLHKAMEGHKLAKDELVEIVPIIKGVVAHYQRASTVVDKKTGKLRIKGDLSDFKEWLRLFVDTCFKLADFQSPKFRAIVVAAAPNDQQRQVDGADNVINIDDAIGAARVYRRIVSAGSRR
jgi:hypothetical protein